MKRTVPALLILFLFLNACAPAAQVAHFASIPNVFETPSPVPPTEIWVDVSTSTETPLPPATPILPATPTFIPTAIPTYRPLRSTPPTLMLHRPNLTFDSLAFLKDFIQLLKLNNMEVVTYRYISDHPDITAIDKGRLFIISIDDIFLPYPIDKRVLEMIRILREAGYPAVLGVVTETNYVDPNNAALLKELSDAGWEIATHTDTHANLGKLEKSSSRMVYNEVAVSMDKIQKVTGVRPITLVLPEGQMVSYLYTIQRTGIRWIAGISDGITYDARAPIIYVGREGPYKNAASTWRVMKQRFRF
jgi:peptidoglycan/xylan/chitin deacetylase (PgdA/CDA1 family)